MNERINLYNCKKCGNTIVTQDIDSGVTPFILFCKLYNGCNEGFMTSQMYNVPPKLVASHEWYRPEESEYPKFGISTMEHIKNGGLVIRKRRL